MSKKPTEEEVKSLELEIQQYCAAELVNWDSVNRPEINLKWHAEYIAYHVLMRAWQPTQHLEDKTVSYPSTWWDAFKERWFPRWALRRWPSRRTTHTWRVERIYPDIQVVPNQRCLTVAWYNSQRHAAWKETQGDTT